MTFATARMMILDSIPTYFINVKDTEPPYKDKI